MRIRWDGARMNQEIIASLMALLGSISGTFAGIIVNTRMINYRLSQLEAKVDKHNHVIDRVYSLEKADGIMQEEIKDVHQRIHELETREGAADGRRSDK